MKVFDAENAKKFCLDLSGTGRSVGPHSFADSRSAFDPETPAPKHLNSAILHKKQAQTKKEALEGLEIKSDGCLVCTDQEALDR